MTNKTLSRNKGWRRHRIPIAPPGHRHESGKDYRRQNRQKIEDEWRDELEGNNDD